MEGARESLMLTMAYFVPDDRSWTSCAAPPAAACASA
jgi:hypothetical protein